MAPGDLFIAANALALLLLAALGVRALFASAVKTADQVLYVNDDGLRDVRAAVASQERRLRALPWFVVLLAFVLGLLLGSRLTARIQARHGAQGDPATGHSLCLPHETPA